MKLNLKYLIALLVLPLIMVACGGEEKKSSSSSKMAESVAVQADPKLAWETNKGIGPVTSVTLGEVDQAMVAEGKIIYEEMCTACHKVDKKFIGPSPKGLLDRRTPEWAMNMILNPEEMIQKDPIARKLLMEANGAPMANQNLTEEQARKVIEYIRTL